MLINGICSGCITVLGVGDCTYISHYELCIKCSDNEM